MNKDRNIPYGFAGPISNNTMNPGMMNPGMMSPGMMGSMNPNYDMPYSDSNIQNRVSKLERQVKRLEQRVLKLESVSGTNNFNDPDNSMYMI